MTNVPRRDLGSFRRVHARVVRTGYSEHQVSRIVSTGKRHASCHCCGTYHFQFNDDDYQRFQSETSMVQRSDHNLCAQVLYKGFYQVGHSVPPLGL